MIDIVKRAFAATQIDQVLDRSNKIFVGQNPLCCIDIDPKLLINLIAADATEIVFLRIEKESFEQSARVGDSRRVPRAKTTVDVLEGFFLIVRRIFSQRLHDRVITRDIDDVHLVNFERHDLANGGQRERFERAGHGHFTVSDFRRQDFRGQLFFIQLFAELQGFDVVKQFDDVFVRTVAESAKKCGSKKLSAALPPIEIDVKKIGGIKLHLNPRTAVRNDSEAVKHLAVNVDG